MLKKRMGHENLVKLLSEKSIWDAFSFAGLLASETQAALL